MVEHKPVESTNIKTIGYDADKKQLHIGFKQSGRYVYHGVEPHQHEALMAAESKGRHLAKHIIDRHRAVKAP